MMNTRMGVMIGRNRRGRMGISQIVFQTVISTIDLLITIAVICGRDVNDAHKKIITVLMLLNVVGVWL